MTELESTISRWHKISLFAVVAVATTCLLAGGTIPPAAMVVFGVVFAASWWTDQTALVDPDYNRWWNLLIIAFLGGAALEVALLNVSYLRAGIQFVLVLTGIKMVSRRDARDELQLYALSFLAVAAATAVNEGVTFGILFGAYVLAATFSLALFHLRLELGHRERQPLLDKLPFDGRYIAVLAIISLGIFVSSVGIFFGFPRVGLGYFAESSRSGVQMSGFSDSVQLGSHGVIRDNPSVALRVTFPDGRPSNVDTLHWRVITFDAYDGSGWERTLDDSTRSLPNRRGRYDLSSLYTPASRDIEPRERPASVQIYSEPLDKNLLPTLWRTHSVTLPPSMRDTMPMNPRQGAIRADAYGDLHHTVSSDIGIPYSVEVWGRPSREELRRVSAPIPTDSPEIQPYLQLPEMSERFISLTERVTGQAEAPYGVAEQVAQHLRSNYSYTTDLPEVDPEKPIDSFLFETQRGHCEYYATAMVLMLRQAGIPARLVNGFLGGRWNDVGDYLAVRQGDAHSWVEVLVPPHGWVQMDPTPAGIPDAGTNAAMTWLRDSYDAARMMWLQYVIEYDLESQIEFLTAASQWLAARGIEGAGDQADGSESDGRREGLPTRLLVFWLGLLAGVAGGCWSGARRRERRSLLARLPALVGWAAFTSGWWMLFEGFGLLKASQGAAFGAVAVVLGVAVARWMNRAARSGVSRHFDAIVRAAERQGLDRRPSETPRAFLRRLARRCPSARQSIERFTRLYLRARFGGRPLDAGAKKVASEARNEVVRTLRRDGLR